MANHTKLGLQNMCRNVATVRSCFAFLSEMGRERKKSVGPHNVPRIRENLEHGISSISRTVIDRPSCSSCEEVPGAFFSSTHDGKTLNNPFVLMPAKPSGHRDSNSPLSYDAGSDSARGFTTLSTFLLFVAMTNDNSFLRVRLFKSCQDKPGVYLSAHYSTPVIARKLNSGASTRHPLLLDVLKIEGMTQNDGVFSVDRLNHRFLRENFPVFILFCRYVRGRDIHVDVVEIDGFIKLIHPDTIQY